MRLLKSFVAPMICALFAAVLTDMAAIPYPYNLPCMLIVSVLLLFLWRDMKEKEKLNEHD